MAGSGTAHLRDDQDPIVSVRNLVVEYPAAQGQVVHAVSDISFDILDGETLGLVGESGCGKSTTGRALMQLPAPTSGSIRFDGTELTTLGEEEMRAVRPRLQMIFQDAISSLNPRRRIRDIVNEGLRIWGHGSARKNEQRIGEILSEVGLDLDAVGDRKAHQFSGGQCQRICIARALVLEPKVVVCDEPVSALDVSVQAQILNLLERMKQRHGLTLLFIAHDLAVVKNVSDRIIVMYLGKICEVAPADALHASPAHPYTRLLLESVPVPDPRAQISETRIEGALPSPIDPPSGCRFRTRCPWAREICATEEPMLRRVGDDHFVACHFDGEPPGA